MLLLLAVFPLPVICAFVAAHLLSRRVTRAVGVVRSCAEKANHAANLESLDLAPVDLGFSEFDDLFHEVRLLTQTLQRSARALQLQVGTLESLVISSEAVRDWRAETARMLQGMRALTPIQALGVLFVGPSRDPELIVFWTGAPGATTRDGLTEFLLGECRDGVLLGETPQPVVAHQVLSPGTQLSELSGDALRAATAFKVHRAAGVGGIAAVALLTDGSNPGATAALRGVLPSLLNLIGALRAIDSYARQVEYHATRDALTDLCNQKMFWELLDYDV